MDPKICLTGSEPVKDFSGIVLPLDDNPYQALITACHDNPYKIQALYATHRAGRNAQQKAKFLSPSFTQLNIDQYLAKLEDASLQPRFTDERHGLMIWARPPAHIIHLANHIQHILQQQAPGIWLMPLHRLHMTTLEVAFSQTAEEIATLADKIQPSLHSILNHTRTYRSRLVKPMITYDLSAFAISFLPAAGEPLTSPPSWVYDSDVKQNVMQRDELTYHHIRRDIFAKIRDAGIVAASRYQVPSAHVTLGRFIHGDDHDTLEKRDLWISTIDKINSWLEQEVWDQSQGDFVGEWHVGNEKGLEAACGPVWYGEARTILSGAEF